MAGKGNDSRDSVYTHQIYLESHKPECGSTRTLELREKERSYDNLRMPWITAIYLTADNSEKLAQILQRP